MLLFLPLLYQIKMLTMKILKNENLTIKIKPFGAELSSIVSNKTGYEYMWQADPKFWKRHSPVLFPIVGSLWNGQFRYGKEVYNMSQHGFARDYDFVLTEETETSVSYILRSNDETLKKYPFNFELVIGYELLDRSIVVKWKVRNTDDKVLYFQIGAHPAFNYPDFDANEGLRGYFCFDKKTEIEYKLIKEKGCIDPSIAYHLKLELDGSLPIYVNTFSKDALIIEDGQVRKVSLLTKKKEPYLSLFFDAPLVGLWSPAINDCPFVCIEPWYGRCDRVGYDGDISGRDYINRLEIGQEFAASYIIEIDNI